MSWQDGLRELDEQLASGLISADEYRARRDQLLNSAVAPTGDDPATSRVPMPPPADAPDVTERTTAMDWQANRPGGPDGDETQVVPGVPTQPGFGGQPPRPAPGGYGQYGPPAWEPEQSPPWGGQEFPPLVPTGSPDWVRQGPEVFEAESGSRSARILLTALAVVLVVGLGAGAYFLFFTGPGDNRAGPGTGGDTTLPTTPPPKPKDDLSTAELPGTAEDHSNITTFADAAASGFLTEDEISIFEEAGADGSRLVTSTTDDRVHTLIFTTRADSASAAEAASGKLASQQLAYGMTESEGAPENVDVAEFAGNDTTPATIRAHYHHEQTIVRIQVNGDHLDEVAAVFEDLLPAQIEVLDAND